MIQPIYLFGSEVLRARASEFDAGDREGACRLITDLKDTLKVSEGCGLAAPQIGVSRRVVIVDGDVMKDVYPYLEGFHRSLVNPEVLWESEEQSEYEEGCLSVPGIYCSVKRPKRIRLSYLDENLERREEEFDNFAARMIQHELSHLDGVLFTDLIAPVRRKMVARKLQRIADGRVPTRYNSKIK